jgi:general secretion pathway protein G
MKKGFTLIELLVVIAIIALLSTLSVVALNSARVKSRDARRLSDIKQIRTALEMYFDQNNSYPIDSANIGHGYDYACIGPGGFQDSNCPNAYMEVIPPDPQTAYSYVYNSTTGLDYELTYHLEGTDQDYIATPATMGY